MADKGDSGDDLRLLQGMNIYAMSLFCYSFGICGFLVVVYISEIGIMIFLLTYLFMAYSHGQKFSVDKC